MEDPQDPEIPAELVAARGEWLAMKKAGRWPKRRCAAMCQTVARYLEGFFIVDNLGDVTGLLSTGDIACPRLEVDGADFSVGPLPAVKVRMFFELDFSVDLSTPEALLDWEENNSFLDWGPTFRFSFDLSDESRPIADYSHWGIEIYGPIVGDEDPVPYADQVRGVIASVLKSQ